MSEIVFELPAFVDSAETATSEVDEDSGETINHADAAVDRLVQQFKNKPKIEAFIRSLCKPMVALEQAFIDLIVRRRVEDAVDDQLKQLARLVGQTVFDGLSNDDLRRYVKARIAANRSCGTGPDILKITRLVINDVDTIVRVVNAGNAVAAVKLENNPTDFDISTILFRDFLAGAVGVGIRIVLEWWPAEETELFEFETFVPGEGVGLGWGSTLDAGVGGIMASAVSN